MSGTARPADPVIPGFDAARLDEYVRGTLHRGPRETLLAALTHAPTPGRALDLGCGLGQETEELLRRGWRVTATDASGAMLDAVRERAIRLKATDRLTLLHGAFEATELPPASFDLVHAGFSLPFCPSADFPGLWSRILAALAPGALFAGQFFGPRDEFVVRSASGAMSAHDHAAVRALLADFEVLRHEEVDRPGETAPGVPKHWHVHHVIARTSGVDRRASAPIGPARERPR